MRKVVSIRGRIFLLAILALIPALAAASTQAVPSAWPAARASQAEANNGLEDYPWVYLRDGQPVKPGEALVELAAVGDTNLGRGSKAQAALAGSGWLRKADIAFANLECALTKRPALPRADGAAAQPYRLVAPPEAARALAEAGVDIAGLANNHALDASPLGLEDTIQALEQAGVESLGAVSGDAAAPPGPLVKTTRGLKVAFLAYNAVPSPDPAQPGWTILPWQRAESIAAVRRAAVQSDVVVVSLHWGYEYQSRASAAQVGIAQALIAAGADLVIGHHPHVTQELLLQERADGSSGLAALSLGNFVFDQGAGSPDGAKVNHGLALRAYFDRDGLRAVQALPVRAGLRPVLDTSGASIPKVVPGAPAWQEVRFTCAAQGCREVQTASASPGTAGPARGVFTHGQIDLDSDRQPEEVRLENFRISIYADGKLDWQSPAEWRVLDLAPGDPDGDGRGDLVLAMEKPDKKGVIQSHPFVIGFRGGLYRTVWGGSPVRDPVKEVELADINGDGQVELLVLEEERGGKGRAVTAWHWHGWGFSLDWRSAYAQYEQMVASGQEIRVNKLRD